MAVPTESGGVAENDERERVSGRPMNSNEATGSRISKWIPISHLIRESCYSRRCRPVSTWDFGLLSLLLR